MDVTIQVLILAWLVLFVLTLQWARVKNRGASIATWIGLTVISWWIEIVVAFVALHATLFSLGREATVIVAVATLALMTLTPVAWAYGLNQWSKHRSAHP
jgi:hypothetical protein